MENYNASYSSRVDDLKSNIEDSKFPHSNKKTLDSNANNKKVHIDNIEDLVKLSFTQIKGLKISDVKGRLFDRIYNDALYSNEFNITSLEFQINLQTEFDCEVCLLGSCDRLGKWSSLSAYSFYYF